MNLLGQIILLLHNVLVMEYCVRKLIFEYIFIQKGLDPLLYYGHLEDLVYVAAGPDIGLEHAGH